MGEGADQQIATEALWRSGAMQFAPRKPQLLRRAIEQFGNLTVDLGDVLTGRSARAVAASIGNRRRPGFGASCGRRLGDAVNATAFLFG